MNRSVSREEKEKIWRNRLAMAASFTGSDREFCQKEGLSIHTFQYWKHKLRNEKRSREVISRPFVRVQVEEPVVEPRNGKRLPDPRWVAEVLLHLQRGLQ